MPDERGHERRAVVLFRKESAADGLNVLGALDHRHVAAEVVHQRNVAPPGRGGADRLAAHAVGQQRMMHGLEDFLAGLDHRARRSAAAPGPPHSPCVVKQLISLIVIQCFTRSLKARTAAVQ